MTLDKFCSDLEKFLKKSNVNLGRKKAKTRQDFIGEVIQRVRQFCDPNVEVSQGKNTPTDGRIITLKSPDPKRSLQVGKGVTSMTGSESHRADEELGRSPYSRNSGEHNE